MKKKSFEEAQKDILSQFKKIGIDGKIANQPNNSKRPHTLIPIRKSDKIQILK